jgi:hypothetical protein
MHASVLQCEQPVNVHSGQTRVFDVVRNVQVLPLRLLPLEQDTDAQAKIIWIMKQLEWRDELLERVLGSFIPNLSELL